MNPRYRQPLILFIASFLPVIAGLLFKIQHWPGAETLFGAGMLVQLFAILWLIFVILKPGKKR